MNLTQTIYSSQSQRTSLLVVY